MAVTVGHGVGSGGGASSITWTVVVLVLGPVGNWTTSAYCWVC